MLSRESSADPGQWRTDRAPYQRGMMDAFSDPLVEQVVIMSAAQIGKTEVVNNIVGYYVDQDPAPLLVVQPNVDPMGRAWSLDRLAPMLRDSPRLRAKVSEPRGGDAGNTIAHKVFDGGHITVVGANSPAGLRSRPIRVVLFDEVDAYPASVGTEGDPIALGIQRTATFWNRKLLLTSTPTLKGLSRIEQAFLESDQRRYYVPCKACGEMQVLEWANLRWVDGDPESAGYACRACGVLHDEADKQALLAGGEWRATAESRIVGFHLNALYSPWTRWSALVREWLAAQQDVTRLQVFVNTKLGETWEERGGGLDPEGLLGRREAYTADVPAGVGLLTCGVDVQDDRLEAVVRGWGPGEESWCIGRHVIVGDPETAAPWESLDQHLTRTWTAAVGGTLTIDTTCIDSGAHTEAVYRFVKPRFQRRVYATKGSSQPGMPLVAKRPSTNNKLRVRVFPVGTDTAKDLIYGRLKITQPGPRYWHFPLTVDLDYFAQLTSEKVVKELHAGRWRRKYVLPRGSRNEVLDCEVLNCVALELASIPRDRLQAATGPGVPPPPPAPPPVEPLATQRLAAIRRAPKRQGWLRRY